MAERFGLRFVRDTEGGAEALAPADLSWLPAYRGAEQVVRLR